MEIKELEITKKNNQQKNEIIQNIIEFVNKNKNILEEKYHDAQGQRQNDYTSNINIDEYEKKLLKVSVVILTANEYENKILNYYAFRSQKDRKKILKLDKKLYFKNNKIKFDAYIIKIKSHYVLHLHAQNTGSYTTGGSSDLVRYVAENEYLHPSCIISFGICFGHSHKTQIIGDTIIAKTLYPYFIGVKLNDGSITVRSHEFTIDLTETGRELYDNLEQIKSNGSLDDNEKSIEGRVRIGNLITGEAVISDEMYKDIFENAAHIISPYGGEMEGYGLGKECIFFNMPCMLIKSICDWGSAKNIDDYIHEVLNIENCKDKIQAYAAYCAYTVLDKLFEEELFEKSLYHRYKKEIIEKCQSGCGDYIPRVEVGKVFSEYNKNIPDSEAHKRITENYIDKFCLIMKEDKVWNEKKNNGYLINV